MPPYPGNGLAAPLPMNRKVYLWQNETVPAGSFPGSLSVSYQPDRVPNVSYPWGLSFELSFSASPGTFSVDILGANTDSPQYYIPLATITQASPTGETQIGGFVWRYDMASNMWPMYVAAYMKTLTNSVLVTMTATR